MQAGGVSCLVGQPRRCRRTTSQPRQEAIPFDKDAFAKHLRDHAERGFGVGKCATYVRQAMVAGGLNTAGSQLYAKDHGPFLARLGFARVDAATYRHQIGDIAVMPGNTNSCAGTSPAGTGATPDFVRTDVLPGPRLSQEADL